MDLQVQYWLLYVILALCTLHKMSKSFLFPSYYKLSNKLSNVLNFQTGGGLCLIFSNRKWFNP